MRLALNSFTLPGSYIFEDDEVVWLLIWGWWLMMMHVSANVDVMMIKDDWRQQILKIDQWPTKFWKNQNLIDSNLKSNCSLAQLRHQIKSHFLWFVLCFDLWFVLLLSFSFYLTLNGFVLNCFQRDANDKIVLFQTQTQWYWCIIGGLDRLTNSNMK